MPKAKTRRFDVITLFPETITPYTDASILGRAQKKKLITVKTHQLRDWATDKHQTVDDTPYGGGAGMLMKVEPIEKAVRKVADGFRRRGKKARVILTAASGKRFTQKDARRLAAYDQVVFICGRYEGVDHRVEEYVADESLSIGSFVLTGGELPAMVMIDAISRMVPGVLGSKESLKDESHDEEGLLEYPQYTKPEVYESVAGKGKKKPWIVPPVLLSGDHKKIEEWKRSQQKKQ